MKKGIFSLFMIFLSTCFGQSYKNLEGIRNFVVNIKLSKDDGVYLSYDETTMRTEVELKLRLAGLKIVEKPDDYSAIISTIISFYSVEPKTMITYLVTLEIDQWAELVTIPKKITLVTTWRRAWFGHIPLNDSKFMLDKLNEMVSIFLNDYLKANPN